jgi:hypothetical protein
VFRIEIARPLEKFVILQGCTLRQRAPQRRYSFAVLHQFDLRHAQFLALREIFFGFIRKIRLPVRSTSKFMSQLTPPWLARSPAESHLLDALRPCTEAIARIR